MAAALADLPLLASGKVREIYELGDRLLIVASDRISTYDVVHPTPLPHKGAVLTGLSTFWFERTAEILPNHVISVTDGVPDEARGRGMVVKKLKMLPVECVVRGYITGSGWKDYQATGKVSGLELPAGLAESQQLPQPLFTPSTKAEVGHDEAIDFDGAAALIGDRELAARVRDVSIALYEFAAEHARRQGIILADTKFELGLDADGTLTIGDEMCTMDSSRLLAGRRLRAGPRPAELRQAVRSRLGVVDRLGQEAAGSRDPRRRPQGHRVQIHRGLRADHGRAVRRLAQAHGRAQLTMRARVLVKPKAGILDPQGQAVERALPALGFHGVRNVAVGRMIELDVDDAEQLPEMCRRLLTNPLIEDFEIVDAK